MEVVLYFSRVASQIVLFHIFAHWPLYHRLFSRDWRSQVSFT